MSSRKLTWLVLNVFGILSLAFCGNLEAGEPKFILLSAGSAGSFCTVFNGSEHTTSPDLGSEALVTTAGNWVFAVSYPGAGKPAEAHKWSLDFHLQQTVTLPNGPQGIIGGPSAALKTDGQNRLFYVGLSGASDPLEMQFTTVDMESGKSAVTPLAIVGRLSQTADGILIAFPSGRYRFIPFSAQTPYDFTVKGPDGQSYAPETLPHTVPLNGRRILRVLPTQIAEFSIPPNTAEVKSELIITSGAHPEIGYVRVLAGDKPTIFYARIKGDPKNPTYSEIVSLDPETKSTSTIALGRPINDFLPVAANKLVIIDEDGNLKDFRTETGAVTDLLKLDVRHLNSPKSARLARWGP